MIDKLIKLSNSHYVIVNDSKITSSKYILHKNNIYFCTIVNNEDITIYEKDKYAGSLNLKDCQLITHSSQPLELTKINQISNQTLEKLFTIDTYKLKTSWDIEITESGEIKLK